MLYAVAENGNCDTDGEDSGVGGAQSREAIEEKISEAIEGMTEKSAGIRTTSLGNLITIFSQQFLPELVMGRKETLRDNLERIFKRGQRAEQGLAATIASLSALQIGALELDTATEDFTILRPVLRTLLLDHTAPVPVRVKVCAANALS
jgi:hypothetical protein